MKYIKQFEEKTKLKIGDYVLCHTNYQYVYDSDKIIDFLNSNVGRYVKYAKDYDLKYGVKYENIPFFLDKNLVNSLLWFDRYDIIDYSDNKEELELKLASKKYNL
jgi:hypothetical protein